MKKIILLGIFFVITGIVCYKGFPVFVRKIMGKPAITVQVDRAITPMVARQIEQVCRESFSPTDTSWIGALKKKFAIIARVSSAYKGKTALITITSVRPIALINDDLVVDSVGIVYRSSDVNSTIFSTLKRIAMAKKSDTGTPEFKIFISKLPDVILNNYTIDWQSPFVIYLKPLLDGSLSVIRFDDIPTQERLLLGQQLLGDTKKKPEHALVDFRFNDQIVIGDLK